MAPSPRPSPGGRGGIGHNGGPPLEEEDLGALSWRHWCWKRAKKQAWSAPREVVQRRAERAAQLGMTYHAYTLEILERGRYL
jgi:hypothetical protein